MSRYETAKECIDTALSECGLVAVANPYQSQDEAVRQMTTLLTTCGRLLAQMHPWQILERENTIVTAPGDTGKYDLPDDFDSLVDVSGWSRDQRVPLPGSVTSQTWQYLKGRNLVSSTIYMVYRETQRQFWVYPQPPDAPVPAPLTIAFEYLSRNWVVQGDTVGTGNEILTDKSTMSSDLLLFNPLLLSRLLILRFKEARGREATGSLNEFTQVFQSCTGRDVTWENINLAGRYNWYPYLDSMRNTPDSGYGIL